MTIQCMHCGARYQGQAANSRCPSCRGPARDVAARTSLRAASGGDEGSGLIDLRAMRAGLAGRELVASVPVLGGLGPASPVAPTRPITRSNATLPASQLPLYSIVVALIGLATLSAHVLTRPGPLPPQVVRSVVPAVVVAGQEPVVDEPEPVEPVIEAAAIEAPVEVVPTPTSRPRARDRVVPVAKPGAAVAKPVEVVKPVVAKPAEPDDSVDCLLGRKQCGKPGAEVKSPEVVTPTPEAGLPAMLEQADISAITGAGRTAASNACGELVKGGERVKLRLSIAGPSGSITSATVVDDAGNPQLAACAAQEVGRLAVKKVQKAQIGAMVTLKF